MKKLGVTIGTMLYIVKKRDHILQIEFLETATVENELPTQAIIQAHTRYDPYPYPSEDNVESWLFDVTNTRLV